MDLDNLPSIDLAAFLQGDARQQKRIAEQVDEVCATLGFLVIERHGVPTSVIESAWESSRAFFDLPLKDKRVAQSLDGGCPRGYFPFAAEALAQSLGVETPPDVKESFGIGPPRAPSVSMSDVQREFHYGNNLWPDRPASLRPALTDYYEELEALGSRVLRLLAAALGLTQDYFEQFHAHPMCALRCLNYPAVDGPPLPGQRGAGEHADYGSITILKSDPSVPGLEVRRPDGEWIEAPLLDDGFIVNIGDLMARWTNDRWVSTLHRVTNPRGPDGTVRRQSMAFFHNASFDARIECIPTCLETGANAKYKPVMAGEYLRQRFSSALAA